MEPRLGYSWNYLAHLTRNLLNVRVLFPNKSNQNTVVFQHLLFMDDRTIEEQVSFYTEQGIQPFLLRSEEINSLNKNYFYLVLGQHKEIERYLKLLRSNNIKALWDQTHMKVDNNKPIWKRRVSVVEAIYTDLITEKLPNREKLESTKERKEWIDFENQIFEKYLNHKEEYKQSINKYLKEGWKLERINSMAVSILLEAISESHTFNTPKLVLITQSIKTAKNYCGDSEYKIINALLENYFKEIEY